MVCRLGHHHRSYHTSHLSFSWRHLLSALYRSLSLDVCFLYVAHQDQALHLRCHMAYGACHCGLQSVHSMAVSKVLGRTREKVAWRTCIQKVVSKSMGMCLGNKAHPLFVFLQKKILKNVLFSNFYIPLQPKSKI